MGFDWLKIFIIIILILPWRFRKAGRVWCSGARDTKATCHKLYIIGRTFSKREETKNLPAFQYLNGIFWRKIQNHKEFSVLVNVCPIIENMQLSSFICVNGPIFNLYLTPNWLRLKGRKQFLSWVQLKIHYAANLKIRKSLFAHEVEFKNFSAQ